MKGFLKEVTDSKIPLLKEVCLSTDIFQLIDIVPLHSIAEERLTKEFFIDKFEVLKFDEPMACDLKPRVELKKSMIPTNINDSVKQSLNNLSLQDRLLLKRAAVLGPDFDLHCLESVSTGMRSDVLQSVNNLICNHIFHSACALENRIEVISTSAPTVSVDCLNICFCFNVYLRTDLRHLNASSWPIGPYHRLKFRTNDYRSCVIAYMTKDQIYGMRMEAADNLEINGTECSTCKDSRTDCYNPVTKDRQARRYSTFLKDCVCLIERPRIYSEISQLYSILGMIFLPIYFKKKAAQALNNLNHPVQALFYLKSISENRSQYWLMSDEDKFEEEAYFDPLVLDVSLKTTKAKAYLLLGDSYKAVNLACEGMELLGIDSACFYGAYKPWEFKHILSKFGLLHAECITKVAGVLTKAHLKAHDFNTVRHLLKIEYFALKSYPIDFIQVLNHMTSMYWFKYLVHETKKLTDLEKNIFKLCAQRLRNFDKLIDLTEIDAIGKSYVIILEVNFAMARFDKAEKTANEAIRILQINNYKSILPLIMILLNHLYFRIKDYENCSRIVFDLFHMSTTTSSRKYRALSTCCLAMFLTESTVGLHTNETSHTRDKCNTFASTWRNKSSRVLCKELAFYVSVIMSRWCLYSDKHTGWIGGRNVFLDCYKLAKFYHNMIDKSKLDYWTVSGHVLLLQMEIELIKEACDDIPIDKEVIQSELDCLKDTIKSVYIVYLEEYKELNNAVKNIE